MALVAVAAIYGINYVWAKDVMPAYLGASGFILIRVTGASMLFVWLISQFKVKIPRRSDVPLIALSGLLGVAGNQLLFFKGLSLTSPVNASIIMTMAPLVILVLSRFINKEGLSPVRILGFVLALVASVLLILSGKNLSTIESHPIGDLLVLANATSYATYLVVVRPLMAKYPPSQLIFWIFLAGWVFVLPFGLSQIGDVVWSAIPIDAYLKIGFVVVFTTFIAYLFNIYAIKVVGSSITGLYIYLQPVLASFFAVLTGAESPHWIQVILGIGVVLGVFIATRKGK
jgi:drug/metabolite transporter (DMT)-like permease